MNTAATESGRANSMSPESVVNVVWQASPFTREEGSGDLYSGACISGILIFCTVITVTACTNATIRRSPDLSSLVKGLARQTMVHVSLT